MKSILKIIIPKKLLNLRHFFYAWYGSVKYNRPSEKMFVIGITGTSGKSSTAYFLRQMLEYSGLKVGSLSTIEFYIDGKQKMNDKKMTMLGKMKIQEYLRRMADAGTDVAIVETTSEGAVQHRHKFINFDVIALTNLYPEHIESHGNFDKYKKAKLTIFKYISESKRKNFEDTIFGESRGLRGNIPKTCVANINNKFVDEFLNYHFDHKTLFGLRDEKHFTDENAEDIDHKYLAYEKEIGINGIKFRIDTNIMEARIFGEHNIMNLTLASAIARSLSISWSIIEQAVPTFTSLPGRIEFIKEADEKNFQVIVDYAFEPVALEELYKVVDILKPKRVIHVCGATGGGRDQSRRKPIGNLVAKKSDFFIITDEDPYDEDPEEIMNQVKQGALNAKKEEGSDFIIIPDRKEAIKKAIKLAEPGDLVLITGKGSEQAMAVKGGKLIPWDDRKIARRAIKEK